MPAMTIDSHQHFWRLERGDYGWLTPQLGPLYRDYLPADLRPLLKRSNVDRTVLVQAAPTLDETRFLLEIADAHGFVAGVVGWADFEASAAANSIAELSRHPKLLGLRPMVQDMADDNWLLRDSVRDAVDAMAALDLRFDALVRLRHLGVLAKFLERFPALRVVVDHGAKPAIADREFADWASGLKEISAERRVFCKLSGLLTEAEPGAGTEVVRRYADHIIASFGADRVMWGSDWPVLNLAGSYGGWRGMTDLLLDGLSDRERRDIQGDTAARFYGIASSRAR